MPTLSLLWRSMPPSACALTPRAPQGRTDEALDHLTAALDLSSKDSSTIKVRGCAAAGSLYLMHPSPARQGMIDKLVTAAEEAEAGGAEAQGDSD